MQLCFPTANRLQTFASIALSLGCWPAVGFLWQPSILVIALIAASVLLFSRGHDVTPGIMLAFSTVKPNLVVFLIAWLMVIAIAHRRFRFTLAFAGTFAALLLASLALVPGWIPRWLHAASAYGLQSGKHALPVDLFGSHLGMAVLAVMIGAVLWRLIRFGTPVPDSPAFAQAVALLLAATVWTIPTNPWMLYNNLLLIPAALLLYRWHPTSEASSLFRTGAGVAAIASFAAGPLCVLVAAFTTYIPVVALMPSMVSFALPLLMAPAFLCCGRFGYSYLPVENRS